MIDRTAKSNPARGKKKSKEHDMNRTDCGKHLTRLVFEGTPIYVDPEGPDWLVPNAAGDNLLKEGLPARDRDMTDVAAADRFLSLLPGPRPLDYAGRKAYLALSHLEECWLHITDHCNLACRHCLFSCSPASRASLSLKQVGCAVDEAYGAGARSFYLTGGEPMMHPDFEEICRMILNGRPDTVLVVLTNGMLMAHFIPLLASFPKDRLFLQISIDGTEPAHDAVRGSGSFRKLMEMLGAAKAIACTKTLAMAVHGKNAGQMVDVVALAGDYDISNAHFLWLLPTGNAGKDDFTDPDILFANLKFAAAAAEKTGVVIDNIKNMASRVFSPANTRHDMSNAGWRSIAVGPDGGIYPTPALIGQPFAFCGHMDEGIETVWKNSDHLDALRGLSVIHSKTLANDPLRFIIGGGDMDHCFYAAGNYIDGDPYMPLYRDIALWLICSEAECHPNTRDYPQFRIKMGDRVQQCRMDGEGISLTHSNCVLTAANPGNPGNPMKVAGDFYNTAAQKSNTEIANPVCYPEEVMDHVPENARIRSYGCGSPVLDAALNPGETLVDLGSGAGMECFIAARQLGRTGFVYGIDMSDPMIALAESHKTGVCKNLGYDNIRFLKGLLEKIPLPKGSADVVISNCVINLSEDKRRIFSEIFRILKPGGRIMISDVVCDSPVPPHIAGNDKLRGECLSGAMEQPYLISVLEAAGFADIRLEKRFLYREVEHHRFFSLTYSAARPTPGDRTTIVYPGPFAAVVTDDGRILHRGRVCETGKITGNEPIAPVILPDPDGNYTNPESGNPCACAAPPPVLNEKRLKASTLKGQPHHDVDVFRHSSGCMFCGKPIVYLEQDAPRTCRFCANTFRANAECVDGHFVCDTCHASEVLEVVRHICITTDQTDMIALSETIRAHPAFPVHGPEHHFMVPGVILAAYRNAGGIIADEAIINGIDRGRSIPGGTCAFWGCCGAAAGAGIALGIILGANPLIADKRRIVQQAVGKISAAIALTEAARCCRRETLTVLVKTAEIAETLLSVPLAAGNPGNCGQNRKNRECITDACPFCKTKTDMKTAFGQHEKE